ncbi:polyketide synthase docking domain-containing protein [Mycobacterium lepromatosis]
MTPRGGDQDKLVDHLREVVGELHRHPAAEVNRPTRVARSS